MEITESRQNSVTVLTLTGRLDGLASPALDKQIDALLATGATRVVFDCSQLLYVSSAGLRVFLTTAKKFQSAGGRATYAALSPAVHEVFELSGFLSVLDVKSDVSSAVA